MNRFPIRLRTALLAGAAAALAAAVIGAISLAHSAVDERRQFDISLSEEAGEMFQLLASDHSISAIEGTEPRAGRLQLVGLFDRAGHLIDGTDPPPPWPDDGYPLSEFVTAGSGGLGPSWRTVAVPVDRDPLSNVLVITESTEALEATLQGARIALARTTLLGVMVVAGAIYLLTGWILRPIESLRSSAESLATASGGRRLEVPPADDEVGRLAATFNGVLDRIDASVVSQQRFIAQASHELRTPLARLRADVDLARRPARTKSELRAAFDEIDQHTAQLSGLAAGLLSLLTAQSGDVELLRCKVDSVISSLRRRTAESSGWTIEVSPDAADMTHMCDKQSLVSALSNLVDNAFVHGSPPVEMAVRRRDVLVEFEVRDHGTGIPAAVRAAVTRPFFRGLDAPGDGAGLGLAIVLEVVSRHGGTLSIEDGEPGCRAVVRIPAASEPTS